MQNKLCGNPDLSPVTTDLQGHYPVQRNIWTQTQTDPKVTISPQGIPTKDLFSKAQGQTKLPIVLIWCGDYTLYQGLPSLAPSSGKTSVPGSGSLFFWPASTMD